VTVPAKASGERKVGFGITVKKIWLIAVMMSLLLAGRASAADYGRASQFTAANDNHRSGTARHPTGLIS